MTRTASAVAGGSLWGSAAPKEAEGACLPGDTSTACIGVYKQRGTITPTQAAYAEVPYVAPPLEPQTTVEALEQLRRYRSIVGTWTEQLVRGTGRKADIEQVGKQLLAMRPRVTAGGLRLVRAADPTNAAFEDEVEWTRSLNDRDQEPLDPSTFSLEAFAQRTMQCGLSSALKGTIYAMDAADLELGRLLRSLSPLEDIKQSGGGGASAAMWAPATTLTAVATTTPTTKTSSITTAGEWTVQIVGVAKLLSEVESEYDLLLRYASLLV